MGTGSFPTSAIRPEKIEIIEASIRTDAGDSDNQSDLTMERISVVQYSHLTNKLTEGRPFDKSYKLVMDNYKLIALDNVDNKKLFIMIKKNYEKFLIKVNQNSFSELKKFTKKI